MAKDVGKIELPVYTRYNGKEFELGTIEIPLIFVPTPASAED